jgi:HlyD family secretion protein
MLKKIYNIIFLFFFITGCFTGHNSEIKISGRIEADEINLSFKMPGKIEKIYFDEGDFVRQGQVIAKLSVKDIESKIRQAEFEEKSSTNLIKIKQANISSLKSKLKQLEIKKEITEKNIMAQINIAANNLNNASTKLQIDKNNHEKLLATFIKTENDFNRYKSLFKEKAISKNKFEEMKSFYISVKSDYDSARKMVLISEKEMQNAQNAYNIALENRKEIALIAEEINSLKENIKIAEQDLEIAKNNSLKIKEFIAELKTHLDDSFIYSSVDILVLRKFAQTGEVVASGQPVFTAYEPSKIYFRGYLPEPYLGRVNIGTKGKILTDSFNDKFFNGEIIYISNKSEFTPKEVQTQGERVKQVFLIKVKADDNENILKPGMPADFIINFNEYN